MWRGRYSFGKLAGLIGILEKRSDSYLTWAKSKDTEVYRAARDAGMVSSGSARPESFEMDQQTQILASLFYLLQQDIHVASRSKKRFKGKQWPRPLTAAELVKREEADRGYDDLMEEIVFMPQEQFDAHIAEHRGQHPEIRNTDN